MNKPVDIPTMTTLPVVLWITEHVFHRVINTLINSFSV